MIGATIWIRPLGDSWQPIGTLQGRGVWHEDLTLTSDQWGPKEASFTLRRPPRAIFPDLLADTPVAVDVAGVRVWAGRIKDTPETTGRDRQISVQCEGGQYHLDDDAYERIYVHTDLTAYRDIRSFLTSDLTRFIAAGSTPTDNGGIVIGFPQGSVVTTGQAVGVLLDMGQTSAAKRVVLGFTNAGVAGSTYGLYVTGVDQPSDLIIAGENAIAGVDPSSATSPQAGSFTTIRRYVGIMLYRTAGSVTETTDRMVRISSMQVFADAAYESGNLSVLTADTIIKDALARGTTLLSADVSNIGAPAFAIPDYAASAPQTPRAYITAANAFHNWRFKIDENLRPIFKARPTAPVIETGAWMGADSDNGSSNNADGVATKVIVRGTGPDGSPVSVTRTQSGTIIDRQGGLRTKTLDASYKLNTAVANQLGDADLAVSRVSPYKGEVVAMTGAIRRPPSGVPVHPAHVLLLTGELICLTDRVDPDTGAVGRNVTIDQVTYQHKAETSQISLDNTRSDFEALQARYGVLVPA